MEPIKQVAKKMFPGYVLINMVMNDDTWYVVRNTRGVTGFDCPGSKPVPFDGRGDGRSQDLRKPALSLTLRSATPVVVTTGAWKDTVGVIESINEERQTLTIRVELFGRETPVELNFTEIKKMM